MNVIRAYITKQILALHPKLKAWETDASYQDAPANKLDETYFISIGDYAPTLESNHIMQVVPVTVRIPRPKKVRGAEISKDNCIEFGSKIMAQIVHPKNYKDFVIAAIRPEKMTVEDTVGNHDVFEINISLNFEIYQSL